MRLQRLGLCHNTAVELCNRCEAAGLIVRKEAGSDHRYVLLELSPRGRKKLEALSIDHETELNDLAPKAHSNAERAASGTRKIGEASDSEESVESESSALRDFTVDGRVWLLSGVALIIGIGATLSRGASSSIDRTVHQPLLLSPLQFGVRLSRRQFVGSLDDCYSGDRRTDCRVHGSLWFRQDQGTRYT